MENILQIKSTRDGLWNRRIGPLNGLTQIDVGKYEEKLHKGALYERGRVSQLWRYCLTTSSSVITGHECSLRDARLTLLDILINRLERHGN